LPTPSPGMTAMFMRMVSLCWDWHDSESIGEIKRTRQ
jgi:hypothetical protein